MSVSERLRLHGFNNLTKSLSFNIYDVCYARNAEQRQAYIAYIDEVYNAERLTQILTQVANIIGANILNIARQDYDPQGASVTILIAEEDEVEESRVAGAEPGPLPDTVLAHLDKSHITVHTYPETHPENGVSTFRADIDVSTCGVISPLKALNFLIHSFDSDIVTMDYRVRGFTRDVEGRKHFIDHEINSIQNYLSEDTKERYHMIDVNVYQEHMFHTKMLLREPNLSNYFFGESAEDFSDEDKGEIRRQLRREMAEIFYGRNLQPGQEVALGLDFK
ncbi:S-adenosylmethionine decarboxylase [Natronocella acetinitrilica]|uniref:S-adenosylmethionine decarboxylase proenzyme n=1 Tax=Natronocella acetinitrilica TaxID=414046 RepID=A0AAE3KEE8_9GAMM|nr:adenosylmethionine decarboxylase [Natronocella acetinitrilica]MCP1673012.1 S-adenosylmethionine decarboxylase [Natronocella acetinitrilica]